MLKRLQSLVPAALACLVALSFTAAVQAADVSGTWTWSFTGQNGETFQSKLTLKQDGDKVSGAVVGRNGNETAIEKAKLSGDEISFEVVRERDGNKFVSKYNGKVSGDTIKGKVETERDGNTRSRDWEAKRAGGAASGGSFTGTWQYSTERNGQTFERKIRLKQEGDKVTGTVSFNENETPIIDGTVKNGEVSFKTERKRNDRTVTSKYVGKLEDNVIKGKITSNFGDQDRTSDLEAKKIKD